MILNRDEKVRDEIIFGKYEPEKYVGGIRRFDDLSLGNLLKLVRCEFIDVNERHNSCPHVETILLFMERYSGYFASGYAVSAERDDYRVSLDGLKKTGILTEVEKADALSLFGKADDFRLDENGLYCWFD